MAPTTIRLSPEERTQLEGWVRSSTIEQRLAFRARLILRLARGEGMNSCARSERTTALTVRKWRERFAVKRLVGLTDAARPGKPKNYGVDTESRILAMLDEAPPKGFARWNGTLLAKALKDVSSDHVWRVLRQHRISLERRHSWCISTDPEFAAKAADVVGLYLNPPEHAVVICVDEKPSIQALERAQGWLRLPNGQAMTGFSHCYKRHGTTTLFAALEVATGLVKTGHYKRRRRREFLDFMNEVVAQYPQRAIHVVLDNLNTHKPKRDLWLARHPKSRCTSPRPTPLGSTKSRSGSACSVATLWPAPASPTLIRCAKPSTPSPPRITNRRRHLSGPRPLSIKAGQKSMLVSYAIRY